MKDWRKNKILLEKSSVYNSRLIPERQTSPNKFKVTHQLPTNSTLILIYKVIPNPLLAIDRSEAH